MAITFVDDTADAEQTDFLFNFLYLEDEHVAVFVDGVKKTIGASEDYTVQTSPTKKIVLNVAATGGEIVRVQRISAPAVDLVDFQNGSVLTEAELDRAYLHNRYLAEESAEQNDISLRVKAGADGSFDALNKKIVNAVDPTADQDAATKNYVDETVAGVALGTVPDGSITYAKIQNSVANNVILGNDNGADSDVQELTAAEVRTLLNVADGATANTGTVVSIASGTGLVGGPITSSGTLSLASIANLRALGNVSGGSAAPVAIDIKDEDAMTSASDTALATQQSIKAYVDSQVLSKWDSGWVNQDDQPTSINVGNGATMVFDHDLGNAALGAVFSVYAAKDSSGTDMQQASFSFWEDTSGNDAATGIQLTSITNSVVNVQVSANGMMAVNSSGTVTGAGYVPFGSGSYSHIRLVLIG